MTSREKNRLFNQSIRHRYATRVVAGFENMYCTPVFLMVFLILSVFSVLLFISRKAIIAAAVSPVLGSMMIDWSTILIPFFCACILSVYLVVIGTPWKATWISDNLHRAGVFNKIEEAPILMHRITDPNNPRISILDFKSSGISRTTWEDLQAEIEDALNCYIVKIQDGEHRNRILLHIVESGNNLPEVIPWTDDKAIQDSSTMVLGLTVAGTAVTADLSSIPHVLIGGATGSGKSVLLKHLLWQCALKGMTIYIADFKGGVDFGTFWSKHAMLFFDEVSLLNALSDIVNTLAERKQIFRSADVANIEEYNNLTGKDMKRIVFACDEIAELLDRTGATKERKETIDQITSYLSTIARQGRAFGIHFFAGTQRPDANILPGQIKNNMDLRICGRADAVLSQIILDKTDAADLIPKDSHKFMLSDGCIFQPYYFSESST